MLNPLVQFGNNRANLRQIARAHMAFDFLLDAEHIGMMEEHQRGNVVLVQANPYEIALAIQ